MEWVLELRSPTWTLIFLGLTALGDIGFYLVFLSLGYWLADRPRFRVVAQIAMVAALLNSLLKAYFQVPRPVDIPALAEADGYSFPSGHAQLSATLWLWLALEIQRFWLSLLAALLIAGIAFSRVYLGVHFPRDVAAGVAIGALTVAACWRLAHTPPAWWRGLGMSGRVAVWLAGLSALWAAFPAAIDHVAAVAIGSLIGFRLGCGLVPDLPLPRGPWQPVVAALLGLAVAFGLRVGLKEAFATLPLAPDVADALRYFAIALWVTWWAPLAFDRLPRSAAG
jgi:hypothetical protein